MLSLYRKYRPHTFNEVIGQKVITRTLRNALESDSLSHAYLFVGPRGTGKTSVAKILAAQLNCTNNSKEKDPCGECESCMAIKEGNSPDVLELDAASNRGIDDIRAIRDKVNFKTIGGKYQVFIIDEVHMLTNEASNALLKTLEEPPENVIFVLCTTEIDKVMDTIKSRCQTFFFQPPNDQDIVNVITRVSDAEKIKIYDDSTRLLIRHARGSYRDALTILEQLSVMLNNKINYKEAAPALGDVDEKIIWALVKSVISNDFSESLKQYEAAKDNGVDISAMINGVHHAIEVLIVAQAISSDDLAEKSYVDEIIPLIAPSQLNQFLVNTEEAKKQIKLGFNANTSMISLLYKTIISTEVAKGREVVSEDNYIRRLEVLEKRKEVSPTNSIHLKAAQPVGNPLENEPDFSTDESFQLLRNLSLEEIIINWNHLLYELRKLNVATYSALRNVKPEVEDNELILFSHNPAMVTRYAPQINKLISKTTNEKFNISCKPFNGSKVIAPEPIKEPEADDLLDSLGATPE